MFRLKVFLLLFCFGLSFNLSGQQSDKDSISIVPCAEYAAGWFHRFLFGDHWRDLWTIPLKAPVLDLNSFAGGLTPIKRGGGMATKSLRFKGNDGRLWKFRSINKDPTKVLPEDLRVLIVEDVVQDQISWSNPLAPLVVAPLLNAVSILQAEPTVVYLPDDEKLGIYRDEFGNTLGMIEIHPDEGEPGFYDSDKVVGTFKLFERLETRRGEKVNSIEFLKARLMDIFLGDWDRHTDQWRWARFSEDDEKLWYPIPRDRDQAFAKFDGLLVRIAEYLVPQFVDFSENYSQVEDITWSGRFLDRRFLTEIDFPTWDSVTVYIQNKLNDEIIENAVRRLPGEHYKIAGQELIYKLKKRRDNLRDISEKYYYRINKYVDVYCSEENDYAEITRTNNEMTEVNIYKKSKEGEKKERFYHKIFDNNILKELRVYLNDGDDKSIVSGVVDSGPDIRIIGGEGKDELLDHSVVNGYLFSFLPINKSEKSTYLYDSGKKSVFNKTASTVIDTNYFPTPENPVEKYEPEQRDRGHDWMILPYGNISSDDGILLGGGVALYSYGFRKYPNNFRMSASAQYATLSNSYRVEYDGIFHSIFKNASFMIHASKVELTLNKYFGYGNETGYDDDLDDNKYYQLKQELIKIFPRIVFSLPGQTDFELGISYHYSDMDIVNKNLLDNFPGGYYGLGGMKYIGLHASVEIDTRDNRNFPLNGNYFKSSTAYFPNLLDIKTHYGQLYYDFRSYYSFKWFTDMTMVLRSGGGTVIGDFPFFGAMFLGGENNLRGYKRDRFSGKSMLFGQAEFRTFLTETTIIIKGRLGINVFAGTGRVFTKFDTSSMWHPSYGAGVWMSFLDKEFNVTATIAFSPETVALYAGTSFSF